MPPDRRFDEGEIARIFESATREAGARPAAPDDEAGAPRGLTLAQLQQVAAEAGIPGDAVARAASAVVRGDAAPTLVRTALGIPFAVSRTVDLGRPVSDMAWDRTVVLLRDLFEARGQVFREGTLREWRNGNLRVVLEPTPRGHRLRLSTRRDYGGMPGLQLVAVVLSAAAVAIGAWVDTPRASVLAGVAFAIGAVSLFRTLVALPAWARSRAAQFQSLGPDIAAIVEDTDG
jgi:hypothetical protein